MTATANTGMGLIRARQGDTVDLIAWREYADTAMGEAILAANPGLAARGVILPQGTPVRLPAASKPPPSPTYTLW